MRNQPSRPVLRQFLRSAEPRLDHPVAWFDARHRETIAEAVATVVAARGYMVYARAILRNDAHFVIRTHRDDSFVMLCQIAVRLVLFSP